MALSKIVPISGVWADFAICDQRASSGTKKMFSARYASGSSSKPSPSSTSSAYFFSKAVEMYFKKINPVKIFLYSAAGMCPQSSQAASQICCSKPNVAFVDFDVLVFAMIKFLFVSL